MHEGIPLLSFKNLEGEIIQLILSRKGGVVYLVIQAQLLLNGLLEFCETLHSCSTLPADVQMCMKEYCCCPKFKRGDNSTYTFTKRGEMYLVSANPTKLLIEFL